MHDPLTVAHEVPLPIPRFVTWGIDRDSPYTGIHRQRRTNEENLGEPVYPWWRPKGWDVFWHGRRVKLYILATIWHVDPERDGSDDSCDWFGKSRPLNKHEQRLAEAIDDLLHRIGNPPYYPDRRLWGDDPHGTDPLGHGPAAELGRSRWLWLRRRRRLVHPRWHVHHWRIQVHAVQRLKRWLFSRCCFCGGRFAWGESPIGYQWGGGGPRWFRGEQRIAHAECDRTYSREQREEHL